MPNPMTGAGYNKALEFKNKGAQKPNDSNKKYNAAIGKLAVSGKEYLAARPKQAGMPFNASGFNKPKKAGPSANEQYNAAIGKLAKPKAKSKAEIKSTVVGKPKASSSKLNDQAKELGMAMRKSGLGPQPRARNSSTSGTGARTYRASKGDSLYSIAEKTVPKGKNVSSWFNAIKKMNAGRRIYSNTGVALPPGTPGMQKMPYPSSSLKPKRTNGPR